MFLLYKAGEGAVRDCIKHLSDFSSKQETQSDSNTQLCPKSTHQLEGSEYTEQTTQSDSIPFPSASLLLDCVRNEYEKERDRMQNLDNKATFFMSSILLMVTIFVPIIPFNALQNVFASPAESWQKYVVCVLSVPLMIALGLLIWAFTKLYEGYKPRAIYSFEISNAVDIKLLKERFNRTFVR